MSQRRSGPPGEGPGLRQRLDARTQEYPHVAALAGVDGDNIAINLEGEDETALLPFAWISDAKLVITDQLLKRGAAARAARLEQDPTKELDS